MTATETAKITAEQVKRHFLNDKKAAAECAEELKPLRERLEEQIAELKTQFAEQNADLLGTEKAFEESATGYETQLREIAIAHFSETGEKTLDENLSVRVNAKFLYEQDEAVAWAEANAPIMIRKTVDKSAFENFADGLDFVTKEETVTAVLKGLK
jgi:hypothetical protein